MVAEEAVSMSEGTKPAQIFGSVATALTLSMSGVHFFPGRVQKPAAAPSMLMVHGLMVPFVFVFLSASPWIVEGRCGHHPCAPSADLPVFFG